MFVLSCRAACPLIQQEVDDDAAQRDKHPCRPHASGQGGVPMKLALQGKHQNHKDEGSRYYSHHDVGK